MVEKLNPKATALSLAGIFAGAYLICVALFAVVPQATLLVFRELFHGIDIMEIARPEVPLGNAVLGLVLTVVGSLIVGWLFALLYNYLSEKMQ